MARNYRQGIYTVKNVGKYVGKNKPRYRSGWEMTFMMFLDSNDNVINWASEPVRIPYRNPLTGKNTNYVPDFLIWDIHIGRLVLGLEICKRIRGDK